MTQQQPANFESDNSFKKDGHFQAVATSLLNASSGDFPASVCNIAHMNEGIMSKRTNPILVNETENSQFNMLSSLVPEGSSSVSTNANSDVYSYLNVPPLPLSTLSSCSSTSGASNFGLESSQTRKRKQHQGGGKLDRGTTTAVHKNARLEMGQEATQRQQNVLQCAPNLDAGVCSRRIMQYMYHLRHRPADNGIAFWRKLVAEYFAPCAKKRWCLSSYDNVERRAPGVFPQAVMDSWQCDLCGSKSGRGFEANLEALPRLNKIMFESGVIDELLYLDLPNELIQFSELMALEYGKAVQVSVYEQFRIVREGKLRIIFTPDLKILSWEFCARHHEELLPQNLVAPQISRLIRTVQRYQSFINCSRSDRVSPHDLQANCNVFLVAGCQLIRNLELQPVDNLGFPKRYVRCLQISEIINSMKDLMTLSMNKNIGPIESLRCYSQENCSTNPREGEQQSEESDHCPSVGRRKLMSTCLSDNNEIDNSNITGCEEASVSAGYFTELLRQNSLNSNAGEVMQQKTEHIKNLSVCKQKTENSLIQKLLQEMINNRRTSDRGSEKWSSSTMVDSAAATRGTAIDEYNVAFNDSMASQVALGNVTNSTVGKFRTFTAATSDVDPCMIYGHGSLSRREQHLSEAIHKHDF